MFRTPHTFLGENRRRATPRHAAPPRAGPRRPAPPRAAPPRAGPRRPAPRRAAPRRAAPPRAAPRRAAPRRPAPRRAAPRHAAPRRAAPPRAAPPRPRRMPRVRAPCQVSPGRPDWTGDIPPEGAPAVLDVTIQQDRVQIGRHFAVTFERTLRIPDDGRDYPLPPGLGHFPLRRVADHADRVPAAWREHGGVFLPMYQREAMWLNFHGAHWRPNALKVAVGQGQRALGRALDRPAGSRAPQDYVVTPPQPWLDGINAGAGFIRQFVAMPLGSGATRRGPVHRRGGARRAAARVLRAPPGPLPRAAAGLARTAADLAMPACAPAAGGSGRDGPGGRRADAAAHLSRPVRHRHVGSGRSRARVRAHRQQPRVDADHGGAAAGDPGRRPQLHRAPGCRGSTSTTITSATSSRPARSPRSPAWTRWWTGCGEPDRPRRAALPARRAALARRRRLAAARRAAPGDHARGRRTGVRSHWRYAGALPLALEPITLGEGCTPLLPSRIGASTAGQAGVVQPDRQLQGPRHVGHGLAARPPARPGDPRGLVRQRRRVGGRVRGGGRDRATILAPESTSPAKLSRAACTARARARARPAAGDRRRGGPPLGDRSTRATTGTRSSRRARS